jgi:hypothetical protein
MSLLLMRRIVIFLQVYVGDCSGQPVIKVAATGFPGRYIYWVQALATAITVEIY